MKVTLKSYFSLENIAEATRTCWASENKGDSGGPKDIDLIERIGNGKNHLGIFEHAVYNFLIEDVSRALLQEFARHRMASLKVKSSRYTLKKNIKENLPIDDMVILTNDPDIDKIVNDTIQAIINLLIRRPDIPNDIIKYALPEAYKTKIFWTINGSSLKNFLNLRSSKGALWEMRDLAKAIYEELPDDHKFMYKKDILI